MENKRTLERNGLHHPSLSHRKFKWTELSSSEMGPQDIGESSSTLNFIFDRLRE